MTICGKAKQKQILPPLPVLIPINYIFYILLIIP
jgi:hypothetical protein